ncbi:MAG: hypothetical protein JWP91_143 [Fibrobacteres bacterium]|nr:hypothetical protein [Fibrobacterota bacterium]
MSNHEYPGHAIPKSTIVGSYFTLVFLTAIMVGLSRLNVERLGIDWIDLHAIKTCLIMGIALVMGIIVSMFLMGLRYESKLLNLTIFLSNFVFLLIFVLFTWADTSFRGEVDPSFNQKINYTSPVKEEAAGEHGAASHEGAPAQTAPASAGPAQAVQEAAPADVKTVPAAEAAAPAKKDAAPAATKPSAPSAPAAAKPAAPAAAKPAAPAKEAAPAH